MQQQLRALVPADALQTLPVAVTVAEGDVASEILAESESADMLVMGTHGRSGFDRVVLGSVTEKVLRRARCPLLTVPRVAPDATEAVPTLFHQILAAVDFSEPSLHALTYAASLAEEADAHLTVLHVTDIPPELVRWAQEDDEGKACVQRWNAYARDRLRPLVADAARVYCHVQERVETGPPCRGILRVATEQRSGLIVIGAHGPVIVERLFVGSTAQRIVRESTCPVLVVRG
jgi:nucleotide-binding universal stress UspA family protein